ncbi:MAG: hypothetical protein ACOH2M_19130 [Cypionkella sp.]
MTKNRPLWKEIVGALCVLALLFLNLGHTQAFQVAYDADLTPYVLSDQAYAVLCQEAGQDVPKDHAAPCHACRIGAGADLPTVQFLAEPAFVAVERVAYAEPSQMYLVEVFARAQSPRAPPLV